MSYRRNCHITNEHRGTPGTEVGQRMERKNTAHRSSAICQGTEQTNVHFLRIKQLKIKILRLRMPVR